jgi:hypothetical protein
MSEVIMSKFIQLSTETCNLLWAKAVELAESGDYADANAVASTMLSNYLEAVDFFARKLPAKRVLDQICLQSQYAKTHIISDLHKRILKIQEIILDAFDVDELHKAADELCDAGYMDRVFFPYTGGPEMWYRITPKGRRFVANGL